jgi:hypothetical protein
MNMIKYNNFRVQSFDKTEIFVNDVALLALENPPKLPRDQVTVFFAYKTYPVHCARKGKFQLEIFTQPVTNGQ